MDYLQKQIRTMIESAGIIGYYKNVRYREREEMEMEFTTIGTVTDTVTGEVSPLDVIIIESAEDLEALFASLGA